MKFPKMSFTRAEFEKRKKEIFSDATPTLSEGNVELEEFYRNNYSEWIDNAKIIRDNYPLETAKFWTELFRSDFTIKFMFESQNLQKANPAEWSLQRKISFIRDAFESVYNCYSFLTFCALDVPQEIEHLREDWFIPSKAKEFSKSKRNPWRQGADKISGKKWVLYNCKFFEFSNIDLSLFSKIRNGESHYKTIVNDKKVFLLNEDRTRDITEEINELAVFLYDCYLLTTDFHLRLIAIHKFWIYPSILLTIPEKFGYRKKSILFDIIKDLNKKDKEKIKISELTEETAQENNEEIPVLAIAFLAMMEYSVEKIWDIFLDEKESINKLLGPVNLTFDIEELARIKRMSRIEIVNILYIAKEKIKEFAFNKEVTPIQNITVDNIDQFDLELEEKDFFDTIERLHKSIYEKNLEEKLLFLFLLLMPVGFIIIMPIAKLNENYKQLFKEIQ